MPLLARFPLQVEATTPWCPDDVLQRRGDNCYEPLANGRFRQVSSCHWDDARDQENPVTKRTDLGGRNALVSHRFAYYGDAAREWPEFHGVGMPARGHRVFAQAAVPDLVAFLDSLPQGVHGRPRRWPLGVWGRRSVRSRRSPHGTGDGLRPGSEPVDENSWSEPRGRCG